MASDASIEAAVLRCGYGVGYFTKADIMKWADRQIELTDSPSNELLDLAVIRHTHPLDVMHLLRNFDPVDPALIIRAEIGILGLLLNNHRITVHETLGGLCRLLDQPGITEEQNEEISYLDEAYYYLEIKTYNQNLRNFLKYYAAQLFQDFPNLVPPLTDEFLKSLPEAREW